MRSNCLHSLLCLFIKVLSQEMSQSFHMVVAIDDSKETFKLAVRIVDLQFVQAREKSRHLEMVLMDGKICCDLVFSLFNNVIGFMLCFVVVQRDRIHVIVKKEDLKNWEVELKEGKTYYMYNFRVVPPVKKSLNGCAQTLYWPVQSLCTSIQAFFHWWYNPEASGSR